MKLLLLFFACLSVGYSSFAQGFIQEGKASFYADKFEGRITASGDRYTHSKSTCAHLSLPFGTMVRVTNFSNGKSIVCRINDRGPFVPDRIIDLSRSAAERLDFISEGLAEVRVEVVDESGAVAPASEARPAYRPAQEPRPTPTPAPAPEPMRPAPQAQVIAPAHVPSATGDYELYELTVRKQTPSGFTVQIASYRELANLLRFADDIRGNLNENVSVQVATVNGEKIYRLMVGRFGSREDAERFQRRAARHYPDCFVIELK